MSTSPLLLYEDSTVKSIRIAASTVAFLAIVALNAPAQTNPAPSAAPDASTAAHATDTPPVDPAKEVEIRKMLATNGTEKLMDQMKTRMFTIFRERQPNVPAATWDRLEARMDSHELLEKLIPLYDKYFTLEDLKAANAFYASPAGQHIVEQTPKLMAETSQVSQEWGRQAAMKVMIDAMEDRQKAADSGSTNAVPAK